MPSAGLRQTMRSGDLDPLMFNFSEIGARLQPRRSQQRNKELKEAYVDIETLDSRLWLRFGLQTIVWGKTESSAPPTSSTRRTSRSPRCLSSRSRASRCGRRAASYSLYDIGPLEDVRLELASNFDQFSRPTSARCGEPFAARLRVHAHRRHRRARLARPGVAGIDPARDPVEGRLRSRDRRADRVALGPLQLRAHRFLGPQRPPLRRRELLLRAQRRLRDGAARGRAAARPGAADVRVGGPDRTRRPEQAQPDPARARLQHLVRVASLSVTTAQKPYALSGPERRCAARRLAARRHHGDPRRHRPRPRLPASRRRARLSQRVLARSGELVATTRTRSSSTRRTSRSSRGSVLATVGSPRRSSRRLRLDDLRDGAICAAAAPVPFGESLTAVLAGEPTARRPSRAHGDRAQVPRRTRRDQGG